MAMAAAMLLLQARDDGALLAELPEALRPASIDVACAVQDAVNRQLGPIAG